MLYYDRSDASKGTESSESKGCNICPYQYFLNKGFN